MRILVTGAKGMLGSDFCPLLAKEHEVIKVDIEDFDVTSPSAVDEVVKRKPEMVCHLAAYTDVDGCERNPESSLTNAVGTWNIARGCQELGIPILYMSTDYIFDGEKGEPYSEEDRSNPLNVYGGSKLKGEQHISSLLERFCIIRSSGLFGKKGKNFVDQILAQGGDRIEVVDDQIGSPTYTMDLASAIKFLLESGEYGTYHITNSGFCSWYEFALKILELADIKGADVVPISSQLSNRPAKRPEFSVLSNSKLNELGYQMRPWEEALADYLRG